MLTDDIIHSIRMYFRPARDNNSGTFLVLHDHFNRPLNDLPKSLKRLTFGWYFNRPLGDSLPKSLTHLTFGSHFNKPLGNSLPKSLIYLVFGYSFNQEFYGTPHIKHLRFPSGFNQPVNLVKIPDSVTELIIPCIMIKCIPRSVINLIIIGSGNCDGDIPFGVRQLKIYNSIADISKLNIPDSVTCLEFNSVMPLDISGKIPLSVTHLKLGLHSDNYVIPPSVTTIIKKNEIIIA